MVLNRLHPAWNVCIGLAVVLFSVLVYGSSILRMQREDIRSNRELLEEVQAQQRRGEERAYINRAISGCSDIINDGEIEITFECVDPRVAAYYPPSICEKLPIEVADCGSKVEVVPIG